MTRNITFKFAIPATSDEVWGVGLVTVKWAMLEDCLDHLLDHMNGEPALSTNGAPIGFKKRMQLFKSLVAERVSSPSNALYLEAYVNRVLDVQGHRDAVAHHIWSVKPDGVKTQSDWRRKSRKPAERTMNIEKLISLAHQLDELHIEIMDFLMREGRVNPGQLLFETAWRRISR